MRRPQYPAKNKPILQALYDSIKEIVDYLPSLEVRGNNKNCIVQETPYGRVIDVKGGGEGGGVVVESGGEGGETIEHLPIYYNNVCRLCPDGAVSSQTMHYESISGASLFVGYTQFNLNGVISSLPSSMIPVETILGGTPTITSRPRTYGIGLGFTLSQIEVPSSDIYSSVKAPYYWDWRSSAQYTAV